MSLEKRRAIRKASMLAQQGQYDKAVAEYKAMLSADPSDTTLYNSLGDLYAQIGSTTEAIASYQKLVDVLRSEGLLHRAIAVCTKIIRLNPDNIPALVARADLYAEEGLRAEARDQYMSAAKRALKMRLDKQALDIYERLIRLDPGDTGHAANLASLLAAEGRQPEVADLLGRLAQELRGKGRLDDAGLLYKQMVEIVPQSFTGWYSLGRTEFEAGRLQEAEGPLRRAAEIDPSSLLPHLLLGQLYEQQMQPDRAKAAWRALLRCDPQHREAHRRLGLLYLNEGNGEAAVRELDAAARSLSESGEVEGAIALLGELGPAADHPLVQERLGELLERAGRQSEAEKVKRRAAELRLASGRVEEYEQEMDRPLTRDPGELDAVTGLPAEACGGNGTAPLAPGEHPSSFPWIEEAASRAADALIFSARSGERPDEMFQVLDEAGRENPAAVKSEDASAERTPGPLTVIDFYCQHGMEAEARALLRRLVASDPGNAEAARRLAALESKGLTESATVAPDIDVVQLDDRAGREGPAIFQALFAELEAGFLSGKSATGSAASSVDDLQTDFGAIDPHDRKTENCKAHYQLGIAYRDMGLLDDAIVEFRRSAVDDQLTLRACNMIGLCLLAKGDGEGAIHELGRGLSVVGRPAEEYHGIKYDLATAHQAVGDLNTAVAILRDLWMEEPSFRDTVSRVRELEERLNQGPDLARQPEGNVDAA